MYSVNFLFVLREKLHEHASCTMSDLLLMMMFLQVSMRLEKQTISKKTFIKWKGNANLPAGNFFVNTSNKTF